VVIIAIKKITFFMVTSVFKPVVDSYRVQSAVDCTAD